MSRFFVAVLTSFGILAAACDSTKPSSAGLSIDGNWEGELSDTSYLLIIRVSHTGEATGQGAEFRPGAVGSSFWITGMFGDPEFLLHFSGPTYPTDFVGTLRADDTMAGEFRLSTPDGLRTRAGIVFARQAPQ
jgi:hypothetical protein